MQWTEEKEWIIKSLQMTTEERKEGKKKTKIPEQLIPDPVY